MNRPEPDHEPVEAARVLRDCAPAGQGQGKPLRRALTSRQTRGHDAAQRARHQQRKEPV